MTEPSVDVVPGYRSLPIKLRHELQASDVLLATNFLLARKYGSAYAIPGFDLFAIALSASVWVSPGSSHPFWCTTAGALMLASPLLF